MLKPGPSSSVSIDLPPSGSKMPVAARTGTPPARKDLNRYLGTDSPTPVRKENLGLNLNLRRNRNKLKTTPDQSPSDENVTFLDSPTSSIDHMGQDLSSLAVERPRKKLSFREPEIMGYYMQMKQGVASRLSRKPKSPKSSVVGKSPSTPPPVASATVVKNAAFASETDEPSEVAFGLNNEFSDSAEDLDLESQAMRVVRTVGQAFEVCHKLSINSPSQDDIGRKSQGQGDQQDSDKDHSSRHLDLTLQQDGVNSDRDTELPTDKSSKKDLHLDRDRGESAYHDSSSTLDLHSTKSDSVRASSPLKRPLRLDIIPPPPLSQTLAGHTTKQSPLNGGEVYSSPLSSEPLKPLGEGGGGILSQTLTTHHELQLMREQLEQQAQQTQAALSQVHLLREQLQVETNARIEAQTRIHQLLTQNKELLDHIQSLVAHLQDQERLHKVQVAQVAAVAAQQHQQQHHQQHQQQQQQQHHNVNSTVPQTPLYLPDLDIEAIRAAYQQQMPSSPHHQQRSFPSINFSSYCPPPSTSNHLYSGPLLTSQPSSDQFQNQLLQSLQNLNLRTSYPNLYPSNSSLYTSNLPTQQTSPSYTVPPRVSHQSSYSGSPTQRVTSSTGVEASSKPSDSIGGGEEEGDEAQFIKPLSQSEPVTTTECDGRVRVIVPVTEAESAALRLDPPPRRRESPVRRNLLPNGPPFITRSTSEKVPNRSELMSQVQRTQWARHTTK